MLAAFSALRKAAGRAEGRLPAGASQSPLRHNAEARCLRKLFGNIGLLKYGAFEEEITSPSVLA